MNSLQSEFIEFNLSKFGFKSIEDLIENFYLKSIVDSYNRINKTISIENDIRDRFINDFYHVSPIIKKWLQLQILHVNWERWVFKKDSELGRADLSFEISGLDFIVECKRLKNASQKYIDDGLHRFIKLEYAENDTYSGMLGFIINGDIKTIKSSLFQKCKSVNLLKSDFSKSNYNAWTNSFKTAHSRVDNSEIKIYHLFFEFNQSV